MGREAIDYEALEREIAATGLGLSDDALWAGRSDQSLEFLVAQVLRIVLVLLGQPLSFVSGTHQIDAVKKHVERSATKALRQSDIRATLTMQATTQVSEQLASLLAPIRGSLRQTATFVGSDAHLRRLTEQLPTIQEIVEEALGRVNRVLEPER